MENHPVIDWHEGNSAITEVDEIHGLDLHRQPNHN